MANRKFSAFTNSPARAATDTLVGLDVSAAAAAQNSYWTLNTLFSEISLNTTDGSIRWGGVAAPALSAAGKGAIYFDSTSNTFKISQNGGAYFNVGNITTTGFTSTRIPIANGANTLIDDAGLTFNTTTDFLTLGTSGGGGATFVGTNGNTVSLAASAPSAATYLYFLPNAAPTVGQFLYAAAVGAQTTLGWQTAPSGTGSANQIAVWGASNALTGSSALTFTSGVVAISGTTNPGVTITGTAATESGITVNQSVSGAAADAFHSFQTPSTTVVWRLTTAGFTPTGLIKANQLDMLGATGTVEMLFRLADASTRFVYGVNNVEAASINATSTLGLVLGVASTLTGRVRLFNSAGATYTQLSAGNAAASLNYILPATSPTLNQVLTASAPSGSDVTLSWSTPSGGSSLIATQVGFGDGSNLLSGSADFTYTTAAGQLSISKTVNGSMFMAVNNGGPGTAAQARFGANADVAGAALAAYSSTFTTAGLITANTALIDLDAANAVIAAKSGGTLIFGMGTTTERARLTDTTFLLSVAPTTGAGLNVAASTVTSGSLVSIAASGTAAASNTKTGLLVTTSGANATASQTTYSARISNTSTGTTSVNIGLDATASGGATNYAGKFNGDVWITGTVGIGIAPFSDPRVVCLSLQPSTTGFNAWEFKTGGDNSDLNYQGAVNVKHAQGYTATLGYANTYQVYSLAGTASLILGNNDFVGATVPYAPSPTEQASGNIRFELGPIWPRSECARFNNSGDFLYKWVNVNDARTCSQTGTTVTATVGTFAASDVGKYWAWLGPNSWVDEITGYIDSTNVTVETSRTVASQNGATRTYAIVFDGATGAASFNAGLTANTIAVTTLTLPTQTGRENIGVASTLSELGGGQAFVLGNNLASDTTTSNQVIKTTNDDGHFVKMRYDQGIAFYTGLPGVAGTAYLDNAAGTGVYERMRIIPTGLVGINTTAPDKALEINSATGNNLRLTYNDNSGSAANYVDLLTTSGGNLSLTPSGGVANLVGNLVLGAADAAAPVARTLSVQNVVAGTSDTAGANWTFTGSRGTGTGAGGNLIWQVAPAGSTGSSQNALIDGLVLTSTGNLYGAALHNNSTSPTGTTNQYIASGTYTPTVTAVTNCTATSSGPCNWIRVGNVVTVSGVVAVDPTAAATFTSVGISLPIASNFATNASECAGVAANANFLGYSGAITADFTNNRAQLDFTVGTDVSNQAWSFSFTYVVL